MSLARVRETERIDEITSGDSEGPVTSSRSRFMPLLIFLCGDKAMVGGNVHPRAVRELIVGRVKARPARAFPFPEETNKT